MTILLEELDQSRTAIIEPQMVAPPIPGFPEIAVTCFSKKLLNKGLSGLFGEDVEPLCVLDTEDGGVYVKKVVYQGVPMALYMSRVGAPACAVQMEEMIARGIKKFVVFGSCGVLDCAYDKWHLILPVKALRDEGVSYHYIEAADEISMQEGSVAMIEKLFQEKEKGYACGKVWTTDAIYRETAAKTRKRKEQGCIAVDMECAAIHAVAEFRGVKLAQFFYAEDNLDEEVWDSRGLSGGIHSKAEELLSLALECGRRL